MCAHSFTQRVRHAVAHILTRLLGLAHTRTTKRVSHSAPCACRCVVWPRYKRFGLFTPPTSQIDRCEVTSARTVRIPLYERMMLLVLQRDVGGRGANLLILLCKCESSGISSSLRTEGSIASLTPLKSLTTIAFNTEPLRPQRVSKCTFVLLSHASAQREIKQHKLCRSRYDDSFSIRNAFSVICDGSNSHIICY